MIRPFAFALREGLWGMRRGVFHSLLAVISLALAVGLLALFWFARANLQNYADRLLGQFQFEAFLTLSVPDDQHPVIAERLSAIDPRWRITYVSREEAAARFQREFDSTLFEILKENPLPASFVISVPPASLTPDSAIVIADRILGVAGIEDLVYDQDLLKLVSASRGKLSQWGGIVGGILLLIALGLTYNAIRLKIDQQREAIHLLSLLGAGPNQLRGSFFLQGLFLGLIAGLASFALLVLFLRALPLPLSAGLDFSVLKPGLLIMAGMGLGLLGTFPAVIKRLSD